LTQAELAEQVAVDRSYLARLEAGATALLLDRSLRILRRLGATITVTLPRDD
jgi:transcriptional regulator with XRE-family HTH domain